MILRLALRSLAVRPWRTAVLAAGFGLGIAVMVALLGVGEVIIEQAHSPALQGGGHLVVSGTFGAIDNARFVLASVLGSPELRPRQRAASPTRRATLYLIRPAATIPIAVRGGIPSLERAVGDPEVAGVAAWRDTPSDASWSDPQPDAILRAMDKFHPVPTSGAFDASWAEWLYFNGRSADGSLRFYLTFMAGPVGADGRRMATVRLQLDRLGRSVNYFAAASVDAAALLRDAPDVDIAGNRVRVDGSQYRLTLALTSEQTRQTRLDGEIVLQAAPGRSLPPTAIHGARGWVSGYVVPVLSGPLHGSLRTGAETIALDGATGYHDHNWGFWEGVRWQWGQVAADDISLVFGRVFPPASVADPEHVPGFLGVLGPNGPLAFSTDVTIAERGADGAPTEMTIQARAPRLDVRLTLSVQKSVATRMALTRLPGGAAMNFLQLGGTYRVDGHAGDRALSFTARGSAETFRSNR